MNKELVINATPTGVELALIEDSKLVELHTEKVGNGFSVGDLFLGKVKRLMPGLNAAFVDVGFEKDAFLHYTDLSPYIKSLLKFTQLAVHEKNPDGFDFSKFQIEPEIVKTGKISEVLNGKPLILVQILKEPISAKGPRLSCEISLPGRFVVITPFNDIVAVSKKIHSSEERKRLNNIISAIKPKNIGVIVRTAAEGKKTEELHNDLTTLIERWNSIQKKLKSATPPTKILSEQNKTTSILRDLLTADFNKIVINDKNVYNETLEYIRTIAPTKENIVSYYTGPLPIFDQYNVTRQIKGSFGKTVNMASGAYLIIERTEACHVIDVNSGYKNVGNGQEDNAIATNMEAVEEIARQLRLRDLGGIIVVDFIDMKNPENKKKVLDHMEECLKNDRARHSVLPLSKFGLMQITRQRMRPEITINTEEVCPSCNGTGKVTSSLLLVDEIEKRLEYILQHKHSEITILVHPIVYSHLTKGFWNSIRRQWQRKYKVKLKIAGNNNYYFTEYHFFDEQEEEIKL